MSEKQGFVSGVSGKFLAGALVCAALAVAAFGCWVYQQIGGLGITGMSNATSWGLYIAAFMFCVGLSAGGLIVASSAHVFKIERFKPVALPAVICSTVCICLAGCFVLIDLGGISRVWNMFVSLNLASPLAWDMCVIVCYLVINVLDMVWMVKGEEHKVEVLSRVALPVAILVHSVTAWIFGLEIARRVGTAPLWLPFLWRPPWIQAWRCCSLALRRLKKERCFGLLRHFFPRLLAFCACV